MNKVLRKTYVDALAYMSENSIVTIWRTFDAASSIFLNKCTHVHFSHVVTISKVIYLNLTQTIKNSFAFIKNISQTCRICIYYIHNVIYTSVHVLCMGMYRRTSTYLNICWKLAEPEKTGNLRKPDDLVGPETVRYSQVPLYMCLCFQKYLSKFPEIQ